MDYYLDPQVQIIHVALSIDRLAQDPKLIGDALGITRERLAEIIATLERLGLARRHNGQLAPMETMLHLSRTSPLYAPWRNQSKLLSLVQLGKLSDSPKSYSFSTVFSATETVRREIQDRFLELLSGCESSVAQSKSKAVYQMSFDLFPWIDVI